jgi:hypothetical protein
MFSSSFHARSNNNSELKKLGNHLPFLKLVRRNRTHSQTQTQGGKKKNRAKDRKKTIIFCELQYPISETEGRKGRGQERRRKGSTLWPLRKNVFFDRRDCGFRRVLPGT